MVKTRKNLYSAIIHYSPLENRRKYLQTSLPKSLEFDWITEIEIKNNKQEKLVFNDLSMGISVGKIAKGLRHNSFTQVYSRRVSWILSSTLFLTSKFIKISKKSLFGALPARMNSIDKFQELKLMHFLAMRRGVDAGSEWILVLEDDAVIQENFEESLNFLSSLDSSRLVWINFNDGVGPNLFKTKSDEKGDEQGFFRIIPGSTRCGVAYAVSQAFATKLLAHLEEYGIPNWIPIDLILDVFVKKTKSMCYWQEPASVLQGSSNGNYSSNFIRNRKAEI